MSAVQSIYKIEDANPAAVETGRITVVPYVLGLLITKTNKKAEITRGHI